MIAALRISLPVAVIILLAFPARGQEFRKINTCFEESIAALRLIQLEDGIARCDAVIEDKATPSDRRGQAYAQRGLMQARRWSIVSTTAFAVQGIADISEALRLHTPKIERKHQLLLIRANSMQPQVRPGGRQTTSPQFLLKTRTMRRQAMA